MEGWQSMIWKVITAGRNDEDGIFGTIKFKGLKKEWTIKGNNILVYEPPEELGGRKVIKDDETDLRLIRNKLYELLRGGHLRKDGLVKSKYLGATKWKEEKKEMR